MVEALALVLSPALILGLGQRGTWQLCKAPEGPLAAIDPDSSNARQNRCESEIYAMTDIRLANTDDTEQLKSDKYAAISFLRMWPFGLFVLFCLTIAYYLPYIVQHRFQSATNFSTVLAQAGSRYLPFLPGYVDEVSFGELQERVSLPLPCS